MFIAARYSHDDDDGDGFDEGRPNTVFLILMRFRCNLIFKPRLSANADINLILSRYGCWSVKPSLIFQSGRITGSEWTDFYKSIYVRDVR